MFRFAITIAAAGLALALPGVAAAQQADAAALAEQRAAIAELAPMLGEWRGPASISGPGGATALTQTERVGTMLDGTILVIEGTGYAADGSVQFNAFAVVSYDPRSDEYSIQTHAQGNHGTYRLVPTETGFTWSIPAGPATIEYEAVLTATSWHETGDYVMPGQPPRRFVEMTLTRIGDTGWPLAGRVGPE